MSEPEWVGIFDAEYLDDGTWAVPFSDRHFADRGRAMMDPDANLVVVRRGDTWYVQEDV